MVEPVSILDYLILSFQGIWIINISFYFFARNIRTDFQNHNLHRIRLQEILFFDTHFSIQINVYPDNPIHTNRNNIIKNFSSMTNMHFVDIKVKRTFSIEFTPYFYYNVHICIYTYIKLIIFNTASQVLIILIYKRLSARRRPVNGRMGVAENKIFLLAFWVTYTIHVEGSLTWKSNRQQSSQ